MWRLIYGWAQFVESCLEEEQIPYTSICYGKINVFWLNGRGLWPDVRICVDEENAAVTLRSQLPWQAEYVFLRETPCEGKERLRSLLTEYRLLCYDLQQEL